MIKVLHVVESFSGGIIHSIANICRALDGQVAFHILHGRRPETPGELEGLYPATVGFTLWPSAGRSIHPGRDLRALAEVRAAVETVQPDVIHAHSSKAGALVRLAYPCGRVPVVYSPRGYAFLQRDKGRVGRGAFWLIERLLGCLPHITVGCGLGEYTLAQRVSGRAVLIPNMVDLAQFAVAAGVARDAKGPLRVAMAGGIRPQKNFPLFCQVAAAFEGRDVRFLWIGDGTLPTGVWVPSNVEITGWLGRDAVLRAMATCHVYMQTSLWEGLPIALLEGMALGLAVLACPAVGNTELVLEGGNGHLCADAESFIGQLRALDRDRARLAAMGAASRRLVEQQHALERIAPRWLSLYSHYRRYRRYG
jgi:glycosyltransferase involved in cell wall biosynthesis